MGAQTETPMTRIPKKQASAASTKKTFVVDDTTPRVSEDPTVDEVRRATAVVEAVDGQQGTVVRRMQGTPQVQSIDGVVLRKGAPAQGGETHSVEGVTFRKTASQESTAEATVSAGEPMLATGGEVVTVVKTGIKVQDTSPEGVPLAPRPVAKPEEPKDTTSSDVYMAMLPENWGNMHWTQKEKFIQSLTDKNFVRFIRSVETIKAVLDACRERLKQLEEPAPAA